MRKDYLRIGEKDYRVECNMSALEAFADMKGWKTIDELTNISAMGINDFNDLIHCTVTEGENMEGRLYPLKAEEQKKLINLKTMREFTEIFRKQSDPGIDIEEIKKK